MDTAWLCSAEAAAAIALAEGALSSGDPLAAAAHLRRIAPQLSPEQAAAALDQAGLRDLARQRYGIEADGLLLTRDGLEQATRPSVARLRAQELAAQGVRRVLDLTGGLGLDDAAFVAAGLDVTTVERDPDVAALLRHNVPQATVESGDATAPEVLAPLLAALAPTDAVFVDPARRAHGGPRDLSTGRARPERDPERWSPPWSFVAGIAHPRVLVKAAPGFDPPPGWHGQWTSVGRTVVECAVRSWPAHPPWRRAVVVDASGARALDARDDCLVAGGQVAAWLLEPDPAVLAASAESALLDIQPDIAALDEQSSWLTCAAEPVAALRPFVRAYRVREVLAGSTKDQRRRLAELGIDRLVVKSRDVRSEPREVLRGLRCSEGGPATLVLTTIAGRSVSVLVEPNDPVPLR